MTDVEFDAWLPSVRVGYAEELTMNGGLDPAAARVKAGADTAQLFPGDRPSPEQLLFVIEAGGERVGNCGWLSEKSSAAVSCGCTNFAWTSDTVVGASPAQRWTSPSRRPGVEG
jgi:hypothetical protein